MQEFELHYTTTIFYATPENDIRIFRYPGTTKNMHANLGTSVKSLCFSSCQLDEIPDDDNDNTVPCLRFARKRNLLGSTAIVQGSLHGCAL